MPRKLKTENVIQEGEQVNLFTAKGYNWGGARPGAGRPKTSDRKAHGIRCTDAEWAAVQKFLADMREQESKKIETRKRKSSARTAKPKAATGQRKTAVKARRKPTARAAQSGLDGGGNTAE